MMQTPKEQQIKVPDLQALSQQAQADRQNTELQLRILAVQSAIQAGNSDEPLPALLERITSLNRFLCTGVNPLAAPVLMAPAEVTKPLKAKK